MTKENTQPYIHKEYFRKYNFSFSSVTDFVLMVAIIAIVSFVLTLKRSNNLMLSIVSAVIFSSLCALFMHSLRLNLSNRKGGKIDVLAHKLYMQSEIQNSTDVVYTNLMIQLMENDGYKYLPEHGEGCRLGKDRRFYFLYPLRRHHMYEVSGQDIMHICDIARRRNYSRLIIAASCKISPIALEFSKIAQKIDITILDMDNINTLHRASFNEIPPRENDFYHKCAINLMNKSSKSRFSITNTFPAIRYLLCAIMLFVASIFMPFKTFYIISAGISLSIFIVIVIFPKLRKTKTPKA